MDTVSVPLLRDQLIDRQKRLQKALAASEGEPQFAALLQDVDAALSRIETGAYGLCETCHEPIEPDRLMANPLECFCLDHLTPREQRALEDDLQLASRIQRELLPKRDLRVDGWEIAYHFGPRGPVSGDYCDVIPGAQGQFYVLTGDVSGKGVAASMLMAHLHALLRTLVTLDLPLARVMERASRMFCESTLPTHYATLVCGKATAWSGEVEICNAGHPPPLWYHGGAVLQIESTGLPVGMFCDERFSTRTVRLDAGDTVLLYTDGIIDTEDPAGVEYGVDRLSEVLKGCAAQPPQHLVSACLRDVGAFRGGASPADDLALMAVRRT